MRILYIDFVSFTSHYNFNFMQIKELAKYADIDCVFKEGYFINSGLELNEIIYIPSSLYIKNGNGLKTRLHYYNILKYLKNNIDFQIYDNIIYSYYEEISFFFARMPKGAFLFNHVNLAGLSSCVKRWFYKRISKSNTQLVFNESMKDYLNSMGISSVQIVAHGIPQKFKEPKISVFDELNRDIKSYAKVLFMPSATSANQLFLSELLSSKKFIEYLKTKNYLMVIKGNYSCKDESNILLLKHFLSDECYKYLLINSDVVILAYHKGFINRVSGVLFECIGNEKNVVMSYVDGLLAYKDIFCANPYFTDIESLMEKIDYYEINDTIYKSDLRKNILEPNYEYILSLPSNIR